MRFEKEKTFGVKQRLNLWYNKNPDQYSKTQIDPLVAYVNKQLGL
jgi:hypothetical protein